ncbi:MFS transporter [Nonomuraea endophytica]|uniref:MFS family permease n=1 Tax=Nonomuraea endophytica TaxID=714136 RepID=A0A7W8A5W5_9ACTN|nr:MFS transporter [Nonomuraea endophytica]MBB5079281.1 MFS family permease [Nonomuraea endophytica]
MPVTSSARVRGERAFLTGMSVDALGSGLYVPLTLLFIHEVTGLSMAVVGLGVTVAAAAGLTANPVAGILIDRFDARSVLVGTYVLRALAFAAYPVVDGFTALIIVAALVAVGDRAYYPASASYVAVLADGARRDRLYALMATARNVAFGLGGLLSAGAVSLAGGVGFTVIAVVNAVSFVVASTCLILSGPRVQAAGDAGPRGGYRQVLGDRPFIALVGAEQAFTLAHMILPVALPIYAVTVLGAPAAVLGVLYALNTFLVASGQLPVRRLQRAARRTHSLALGGAVLIAACGAYAAAALLPPGPVRIGGLVAATLILTVGELMHTVPSWALAAGAAPPAMRGRYLAIYQLTWAVAAVVAPAGFSALLTSAPPLLWATLGVLLAAAALTVVRLARRLPAEAVMAA